RAHSRESRARRAEQPSLNPGAAVFGNVGGSAPRRGRVGSSRREGLIAYRIIVATRVRTWPTGSALSNNALPRKPKPDPSHEDAASYRVRPGWRSSSPPAGPPFLHDDMDIGDDEVKLTLDEALAAVRAGAERVLSEPTYKERLALAAEESRASGIEEA